MPRYASRRDENEPDIIKEFILLHCKVQRLEPPAPDLLVGLPNGKLILVEVKDPDKTKRYGKRADGNLTARQREWHKDWDGHPIHVVETVIEARGLVYEHGSK